MNKWDLDFDEMCRKLRDVENFSFCRFGDGEWSCVLGRNGMNCDKHRYLLELSLSLAFVLLQPQRFYCGMQPKGMRDLGDDIKRWIVSNECELEWCNADIIHDASIEGRLGELWTAARRRKKILVGPNHLKPIANKYGCGYVFVPDRNCFKWRTTIEADIGEELAHAGKDAVILYCASMLTEVLIDSIHTAYGDTLTQIDAGSALDPYVGVNSRRYHKQIIERLGK